MYSHELRRVFRPFGGAEGFLDVLLGHIHTLFGVRPMNFWPRMPRQGRPFIGVSRFDVAELDVLFNKVFNALGGGIVDARFY